MESTVGDGGVRRPNNNAPRVSFDVRDLLEKLDATTEQLRERVTVLERDMATGAALATYRRWLVGVGLFGVLNFVANLVALAQGGTP